MKLLEPFRKVRLIQTWIIGVFWLLLVGLLTINTLLIVQNRGLKRELASEPPAWRPAVGTLVPPLDGIGLNGEKVHLEWNDRRDTFVFAFSPRCGVCDDAWPKWRELANQAKSDAHRLVYMNVAPPLEASYIKKIGLNEGLVIAEADPKTIDSINTRLVPLIIRISSAGRIEEVWLGVNEEKDFAAIKRALR